MSTDLEDDYDDDCGEEGEEVQNGFNHLNDTFCARYSPGLQQILEKAAQWIFDQTGVDSVRVFATAASPDDVYCHSVSTGRGNFYTQKGAVQDWVTQQDEITRSL